LRLVDIFHPPVKRPSRTSAERRNRWIVQQADAILAVHGNPKGLTEKAACLAVEMGKPVFALDDPSNSNLAFAERMNVEGIVSRIKEMRKSEK